MFDTLNKIVRVLPACPFCKQKAIIVSHPGGNWDGSAPDYVNVGHTWGCWYVGCPNISFHEGRCEVAPAALWYAKLDAAIIAWSKCGTKAQQARILKLLNCK